MYDRLHRLGLCMSYSRSLEVMEVVGGYNASALVDALKNGRYIRFIGDNLNFTVDVHDERLATHKHMVHMFATAALVSETSFEDVPNVPEIPLQDLNVGHISLSREEYSVIRSDCVHLICNIVADFLPQLSFMSVTDNNRHNVNRPMKTTVIPLEVLPLNEQYYGDDVEILLYYEKLIRQIHNEAGIPLTAEHQYQIGGDQLTRERFSKARFLRLRNAFPEERIDHLSPVTFEFLHLMMNFLTKLIFRRLYGPSVIEVGTLKHAKQRLHRNSVDPEDLKKYDTNKDFFLSFFRVHVVEAVMDFFGMENRHSQPTSHVPPVFDNEVSREAWVHEKVGEIVDKYVFPHWSGNGVREQNVRQNCRAVNEMVSLRLRNGQQVMIGRRIREETHAPVPNDGVKNYAHLTLEVGMLFAYLQSLIKRPDRARIIGAVKMLLPMMKANKNNAKYPLELLRFIIQQKSLLTQRSAHQVLDACFVNTRGKADSHVPADQQMEWIVKANKKHVKHMYSNKREEFIQKKSMALYGIGMVAQQFDDVSDTLVRAKKHGNKSAITDELTLLDEFERLKPFRHTGGRHHDTFRRITPSMLPILDAQKFRCWIMSKKLSFTP